MEKYVRDLIEKALDYNDKAGDYLHRLVGYLDAQVDFKPILHFVSSGAEDGNEKKDKEDFLCYE